MNNLIFDINANFLNISSDVMDFISEGFLWCYGIDNV